VSDRRKRQLPLVKCEDGIERYTRDNEDGVMRWDEREGERRIFDRYHDQFLRDTLSGGVDVTLVEAGMAREILQLRKSIATLRDKLAEVCEAASATQKAFEEQAECGDCDAKAEAMGGRVDPLCDVCMERWAVSTDALDDAIAAAREGK